jgi:hypothetical protein
MKNAVLGGSLVVLLASSPSSLSQVTISDFRLSFPTPDSFRVMIKAEGQDVRGFGIQMVDPGVDTTAIPEFTKDAAGQFHPTKVDVPLAGDLDNGDDDEDKAAGTYARTFPVRGWPLGTYSFLCYAHNRPGPGDYLMDKRSAAFRIDAAGIVQHPNRAKPRLLHATIDIDDDFWRSRGRLSVNAIRNYMKELAQLGVRRVYWMVEPEFLSAGWSLRDDRDGAAVLPEIVRAAHDAGLEHYFIYKPFETGVVGSVVPPATRLPPGLRCAADITGPNYSTAPFLIDHPEFRMRPRPSATAQLPISEVRLIGKDDGPTTIRSGDLELWTAQTNGDFSRYAGPLAFADDVEQRGPLSVRVLRLSGFSLGPDVRYLLIQNRRVGATTTFANQPSRMVELVSADGALIPASADQGKLARDNDNFHRLYLVAAGKWDLPTDLFTDGEYGTRPERTAYLFETWGMDGRDPWRALDGAAGGLLAIARGRAAVLNILQPLYPEVRDYWMRDIAAMTAAGCDGIDFRIDNHSAWIGDPDAYGFDPPVVEAYRQRYGKDILTEPFDRDRWRALQGDAYTAFLRSAREYTRARKVKMQVHVNGLMGLNLPNFFNPNNLPMNIEWQWQRWIEEDLADSVLLKNVPWWWGSDAGKGADFAEKIIAVAKKYGKPVVAEWRHDCWWLVCGPGHDAKNLTQADVNELVRRTEWAWCRDDIAAIVLYEGFDFVYLDPQSGKAYTSPAYKTLLAAVQANRGNEIRAEQLITVIDAEGASK